MSAKIAALYKLTEGPADEPAVQRKAQPRSLDVVMGALSDSEFKTKREIAQIVRKEVSTVGALLYYLDRTYAKMIKMA